MTQTAYTSTKKPELVIPIIYAIFIRKDPNIFLQIKKRNKYGEITTKIIEETVDCRPFLNFIHSPSPENVSNMTNASIGEGKASQSTTAQ